MGRVSRRAQGALSLMPVAGPRAYWAVQRQEPRRRRGWESGDEGPGPVLGPPGRARMPALPAGVSAPNPGDSHRLHTAPSGRLGPGGQPGAGTTSLPGEGTVGQGLLLGTQGRGPEGHSPGDGAGMLRAHRRCHRPPRRCRPCSRRRRRSASAGGCSGRSCTGTGPCHSGACSLSAGQGAAPGQIWAPLRPPTPLLFPAHLVRAVGTVVVPVAFPAPSDAAAIGTGELTFGAGPRGWKDETGPGEWA